MRAVRLAVVIVVLTGAMAHALDVPLSVTNREKTAKTAEPVTSGVPFARGVLKKANQVRLLSNGAEVPAQFLPTASWPDGSIRWVLCDFQADLPASGSTSVTLQTGKTLAAVSGITVTDQSGTLTINTRAATFSFTKSELSLKGIPFEVSSGGSTYRAVPSSSGWTVEERGPMKVVVRVEGGWNKTLANTLNRFRARLVFYRDKSYVRVFLTFRNNNSFGWDPSSGGPRVDDLVLTGATFGISLLAAGGSYVFGSGVEKTWELVVPSTGSPVLQDSRYTSKGALAAGYTAPRPLAAAQPQYYASTKAWGLITPPLTGFPSDQQVDFDLFERIQRAKVIQKDVQNPPNTRGITLWEHLNQDIRSWNDYGDIRWGGDCGELSGNHYDWSYGMYLQFLRTGKLPFADAASVLARHEIDLDIYHTGADGAAFNYMKNWETRPSHDNPDNCFGGGRPTHTWATGYALHWLLTGDPRGRDGYEELIEGIRQYTYESFNGEGYVDTNEIRTQGWLTENLVTLYRINPKATLRTSSYGKKTIPNAIKDILQSVFDREEAAGKQGYVYAGDPADPNQRQPLMNMYILEPLIHAYDEVFLGRDAAYAAKLKALILRMTDWVMSITYGGDTNGQGLYRPRQIPYWMDLTQPNAVEGQPPYCLMAANAAGFCYLATGTQSYRDYARAAFSDYVRYVGVAGGDSYVNTRLRTPACFNSVIYVGTESKIHGWSSRFGQYYLAAWE